MEDMKRACQSSICIHKPKTRPRTTGLCVRICVCMYVCVKRTIQSTSPFLRCFLALVLTLQYKPPYLKLAPRCDGREDIGRKEGKIQCHIPHPGPRGRSEAIGSPGSTQLDNQVAHGDRKGRDVSAVDAQSTGGFLGEKLNARPPQPSTVIQGLNESGDEEHDKEDPRDPRNTYICSMCMCERLSNIIVHGPCGRRILIRSCQFHEETYWGDTPCAHAGFPAQSIPMMG